MKLSFATSANGFVLDAFDKQVNDDGYIVEKTDPDQMVLTQNGEPIMADEFAGIRHGSTIFIKSDMESLIEASDAIDEL